MRLYQGLHFTGWAAVLGAAAAGQSTEQAATQTPVEKSASVAATVNGVAIPQSSVDEAFIQVLQEQFGGQVPPGLDLDVIRTQLVPDIIDTLIANELIDQDVARAHLTVTQPELRAEVEKLLDLHLARIGQTREQFVGVLEARGAPPLKEIIAQRAAEPEFEQFVLHKRLLHKHYETELTVSPFEIKAKYDQDLSTVYTRPAEVRASHILVRSSPEDPPAQREQASQKATAILADARKAGADFASLARDHSEGPSAGGGGDLGFFPREGSMVEPFAEAAFSMKTGEISGPVETQFGFHIIKVTDRKEAHVVPLNEATTVITEQLKAEKLSAVRTKHVENLRKNAKIEFTGAAKAPEKP